MSQNKPSTLQRRLAWHVIDNTERLVQLFLVSALSEQGTWTSMQGCARLRFLTLIRLWLISEGPDSTLTRLDILFFQADSTLTGLIWVRVESDLTHDSWVEHNPGFYHARNNETSPIHVSTHGVVLNMTNTFLQSCKNQINRKEVMSPSVTFFRIIWCWMTMVALNILRRK